LKKLTFTTIACFKVDEILDVIEAAVQGSGLGVTVTECNVFDERLFASLKTNLTEGLDADEALWFRPAIRIETVTTDDGASSIRAALNQWLENYAADKGWYRYADLVVQPVERAVRVRTGERDAEAVWNRPRETTH
jgi:nitrogen regulatory protein PII